MPQPPSPPSQTATPPATTVAGVRTRYALAGAAVLGLSVFILAVAGQTGPPRGGIAAVIYILGGSAAGAAYILSAIGLGVLVRPLFKGVSDGHGAQVALGLSIQFTLSHLLGWSGLLAGRSGLWVALIPIVLGLALGAGQGLAYLRGGPGDDRKPLPERFWDAVVGPSVFAFPAVAVLLVAACSPPGWLWGSEFGGFDALSYHAQLPQEWLATGRLSPLQHNVYSFLPSYFESAFMHVAVLSGAPAGVPGAMLASDGRAVLACQILHALTAVSCALLAARTVRWLVLRAAGPSESDADARARHAGALAGGILVATPWVVVVGSLAYNEMAMCSLFLAALGVAADRAAPPVRRWVLAAWLVGVACGVKPTAITFAAFPVAIMLVGMTPARSWLRAAPAAAGAGLLALCPWLIRNFLVCGNPVFPYLTGVFGSAHWAQDQVAKYLSAHQSGLSPGDRLRLLVAPDASDPAGPRHRGLLHPQWAAFFPLVIASLGAIFGQRDSRRRVGVLLFLGLTCQVILWLTTTHLQSRFLLPLAVPGALLIGLAAAPLLRALARRSRALASVVIGIPILIQAAASIFVFLNEQRGRPNEFLSAGPGLFSGEVFQGHFQSLPPADRESFLAGASPEVFCNFTILPPDTLYLLGDSTPFYFLCPVVYHTTWDRSPLGAAARAAPDEPAFWARSLRSQGITHVLYNPGEIARLSRTGWYDPAVTPEIVKRFLDAGPELVHSWPHQNRYLFRLR